MEKPPGRRLTPRQRDVRLETGERLIEFRAAAEELRTLNEQAVASRDGAIAAIHNAVSERLRVGLKLLELRERFAGDFDEWLEGYCSEIVPRTTAYRWMAKVRDLKAVLGKEDPTFEELKRAQLAAETLPEPLTAGGSHPAEIPPFRLRFELPSSEPPEKWEPGVQREFLRAAKGVVDTYEKVQALVDAA